MPALLKKTTRHPDREESSWDEVVRRYDRRVVVSLLAMGIRSEEARDLTQKTWTRLIEQHRAGRLASLDFPGLAIKQARFLALDALRRERRERSLIRTISPDEKTIADRELTVEERLLEREDLDRALEVIAGATPVAQQIFRLVYGDPPLAHKEVAARVGLSVQRVRQILCEVRSEMREALEDER